MYGQQPCQMRPMQQVPLSPQTSSQYAPSSSSPPLTPLHLAGVSDGSGSPVPMPLAAGPATMPGMILPVGGLRPQDRDQYIVGLLAVAGSVDPSRVHMMPTADVSPGSPA